MLRDVNKENKDKNLKNNLNNFLKKTNQQDCSDEECLINNPDEIVKRENKRIVTNDGRQLLNEYTN